MRKALAKSFLAVFLLLAGAAAARAFGTNDKGTSGAQFLKIAPGARASGMGEAFAGLADDVEAVYYNPAGLGNLRRVEVTGMHDSYFQGLSYEFAALAVPLLSWVETPLERNSYGVMGAAVYNLSVSNIERRGTTETDSPVDTFGASDLAYSLSYAYAVPDTGLSIGLTGKYVNSTIDSARASAYAADLGALYKRYDASFGAGVRNVGTKYKFTSTADPLPAVLYAGAGYHFGDRLLGSLEIDSPRDNKVSFAFGGEFKQPFADKLFGAVRAGYNSRNTDAGGLSGMSFGLGLGYANFGFDFALVPFGDLGNTYKYSMLVRF